MKCPSSGERLNEWDQTRERTPNPYSGSSRQASPSRMIYDPQVMHRAMLSSPLPGPLLAPLGRGLWGAGVGRGGELVTSPSPSPYHQHFPAEITDVVNIGLYFMCLSNPCGLVVSGISCFISRHATSSDLAGALNRETRLPDVVVDGELGLTLDSGLQGLRKFYKRGDICVQRATMHAFKNTNVQDWTRMLFFSPPIEPTLTRDQFWKGES